MVVGSGQIVREVTDDFPDVVETGPALEGGHANRSHDPAHAAPRTMRQPNLAGKSSTSRARKSVLAPMKRRCFFEVT